jgi:3-deoxy-D-manno-octulosonate 8-phosphate phosphatase (KDO 8-P phosphatase)
MNVFERLAKVELLLVDVDGVLTDGKIILDDHGVQSKAFDVRDGHGIKMLQRAGVAVGIITGRESAVVNHRARELGIEEVWQGAKDKLLIAREILKRRNLSPAAVAYVGDDVVDLPVMLQVGVGIAVANACEDVRARAHWVTEASGGAGAVREVCEAILKARGAWESATQKYFRPDPL